MTKIYDRLSDTDKINMLNGTVVGLFSRMIIDTDPFYDKLSELCLGYYTSRSGEKTISPTYSKIIDLISNNVVSNTAEDILGNMIRGKFIDKWNRVYNVLIATQYNPMNDYEENTVKSGANDNTRNFTDNTNHTGTNTDKTTYNTTDTFNETTSEKEQIISSEQDNSAVYGFNSSSPVNDSNDDISSTETRTRDPLDNTRNTTNNKSGEDTLEHTINSSDNKSFNGTVNNTYSDNIDTTGRNTSPSSLVEKELNLRNKFLFFDIVYADIDSIATIQIYI